MTLNSSVAISARKFLQRERRLWNKGYRYVAGVDEAGRGPLAGPVVAAAVVFPRGVFIHGVDDSKRLTRPIREELYPEILRLAVSVGVGVVQHDTIDAMNIREASALAMEKAIAELNPTPDYLLVDGNYFRDLTYSFRAIVGGDGKSFSIAAASIVAKVRRDRLMDELHKRYPLYGFDRHKGYATKQHINAIRVFGPCDVHRRSFHVKELTFEDIARIEEEWAASREKG